MNAIYLVALGLMTKDNPSFKSSMIAGYIAMAVALSFIFVGVYQAKKLLANEPFGFGRAFYTGLLISLISSLFYTFTWLAVLQFIHPNFMLDYTNSHILEAQNQGMSAQEIDLIRKEMDGYVQLYKNPLWAFLITLTEILPVGLLLSLLAGAIFKKKDA
jgi:hypothetical protein